MNRLLIACVVALVPLGTRGESDINLGDKLTTFTNLQGRVYENVRLERGTLDGVIYSVTNGIGGGMVKYKDLPVDFIADLNIPTNRIEIAAQREKRRAEEKARYDAAVRELALKQQQQAQIDASNALARAKATAQAQVASPKTTDQSTTTKVRVRRK